MIRVEICRCHDIAKLLQNKLAIETRIVVSPHGMTPRVIGQRILADELEFTKTLQ